MNYKRLYTQLIEDAQSTDYISRIKRRNPDDERLSSDYIYTEMHHIVPKFDKGDNSETNLVRLLPEEHFLAHLIRYKALKLRGDFLSVRFIINGIKNKKTKNNKLINVGIDVRVTNKIVCLFKQHISSFRKIHGWQSEDGRRRISEARKGMMPVVEAITRKKIGQVSINHPNVISGKWVHHSKGRVIVENILSKRKFNIHVSEYDKTIYKAICGNRTGSNNGNFKEMTPWRKKRIFDLIPKSVLNKHLIVRLLCEHVKIEFKDDFKKISRRWLLNNFISWDLLLDEYYAHTNIRYKYNQYYREKKNVKN